MLSPPLAVRYRMAPAAAQNAKQHGYMPLRAASPPKDSSSTREYPLNRRVSPGVEHRRPVPRGIPKTVGKTTIAPGQVRASASQAACSSLCSTATLVISTPCIIALATAIQKYWKHMQVLCDHHQGSAALSNLVKEPGDHMHVDMEWAKCLCSLHPEPGSRTSL